MRARRAFSNRFRALSFARALALVAMLLQAVLYAEHAGASAVAAAGHAPEGTRGGFLQICTGEGIILMPVGGAEPASQTGAHSSCPICTSPGACGFDMPQASAAVAFQPAVYAPVARRAEVPAPVSLRLVGLGQIRAPPHPLS